MYEMDPQLLGRGWIMWGNSKPLVGEYWHLYAKKQEERPKKCEWEERDKGKETERIVAGSGKKLEAQRAEQWGEYTGLQETYLHDFTYKMEKPMSYLRPHLTTLSANCHPTHQSPSLSCGFLVFAALPLPFSFFACQTLYFDRGKS